LHREGDVTARVAAQRLGITERSVRRILRDLEREGYIEHQRKGRLNSYRLNLELPLRRMDQVGVSIGDLLKILGSSTKSKSVLAQLDTNATKDNRS
jgi:predicted ArsR family transcriptional regulator